MRRDSVMTVATIALTWLALHFLTAADFAGGAMGRNGQPAYGVVNALSTAEETPGPALAFAKQPTPSPEPTFMLVGNTGGDGVGVRREPKEGNRIGALVDGTRLTQLGQLLGDGGASWTHVRLGDGREGYVPSKYLVPGDAGGAGDQRSADQLELLATIGRYERNLLLLEGQVRNLGAEDRERVQVVVEWLDAEERLITAQTGSLEFDPLPAGGEAPFRVAAPARPGATQYRVNFKQPSGEMIPFLDSR